jgi:hypothetical protein
VTVTTSEMVPTSSFVDAVRRSGLHPDVDLRRLETGQADRDFVRACHQAWERISAVGIMTLLSFSPVAGFVTAPWRRNHAAVFVSHHARERGGLRTALREHWRRHRGKHNAHARTANHPRLAIPSSIDPTAPRIRVEEKGRSNLRGL